jgi:hypothetical protein
MVELKDEIVPLTGEDLKVIHEQMKFKRGCSYFFVIAAVLIIGFIVLPDLINSRPIFGDESHLAIAIITVVVVSIILLINYLMSRQDRKQLKANIKRVYIAPVAELIVGYRSGNGHSYKNYYFKVRGNETGYEVKKEFYEQLKEGDLVEIHEIPETNPEDGFGTTRVFLRDIVKVSDAR